MLAAIGPALVAVPAAARDGVSSAPPAPASAAATIAVDARALLMAEATVHGGDLPPPTRDLLALPGSDLRTLSALIPADGAPLGQAYTLPSIPAAPAVWNILLEAPRKSRLDAAPIERMSLEGTADYSRSRTFGLDARLELRIDGREDSAMVRLGGRVAGMLRNLERR
ncbi:MULTISPECIES: hypothetical protein [unclassified Sphingomonas]|uniref:hypothetical protein n=1 Tax=unclassified Sphingomonas TaxID=196159 RepID=UPI00082C4290|nr:MULTISPECIES: hypothetical protein [unclassified Sphingomonas]